MQLGLQAAQPYRKQIEGTPVHNERRFSHTWLLGKTRVGKTTALQNWILDDIYDGHGVLFIDPHGDAIEELLAYIPPERQADVVLCDFADFEHPIPLNVIADVPYDRRSFVANAVVSIFKNLWGYAHVPTPQLDQYLYNGTAALLETPNSTLLGLNYLLKDNKTYRHRVIGHVLNPVIKDFWENDFEAIPDKERRQSVLSTLNKIGMLIADPAVRNIIGQPKMSFSIKDIMDSGKILLVSVPQGKLGIEKSAMLGSLVLTLVHLTALERVETTERRPFHCYLDEMHHFGTAMLAEMLSGVGKFGISLTLAHQYIHQLTAELRQALIGTVGTIVTFRIGATDAETLAPEFGFESQDTPLPQLPPYTAYAKTDAVHLLTMPPLTRRRFPFDHRTHARRTYAGQRPHVEKKIMSFIQNA